MSLRSFLFVPGDSERKMAKVEDSEADALILDLEDSVAANRTEIARGMVRDYLQSADRSVCQLWVRMNPLDGPHALLDLAGVIQGRPDGFLLPKAQHSNDTRLLGKHVGRHRHAVELLHIAH